MAGASLMFFGFLGFESISMTVDEIKEPQKNVPRGIVLALIIVAALYAVVSLVLTGAVHYTKPKRRVLLRWLKGYQSKVSHDVEPYGSLKPFGRFVEGNHHAPGCKPYG